MPRTTFTRPLWAPGTLCRPASRPQPWPRSGTARPTCGRRRASRQDKELASDFRVNVKVGYGYVQNRRHAVSSRTSFHGLRPRRRPRQPLLELTDERAKPPVFFGKVPHHRFCPFECSEFRRAPHCSRHSVQGPQPDPPYAARMELPPSGAERELRHPSREPARLGADVVREERPMRYSRISTSFKATARSTSSSWQAITSTRWTMSSCSSSMSARVPM